MVSFVWSGKEIGGSFPKDASGGGGGANRLIMRPGSFIPMKISSIMPNAIPPHLRTSSVSLFALLKVGIAWYAHETARTLSIKKNSSTINTLYCV